MGSTETAQPQAVAHHEDRGQRHRTPRDHRVEQPGRGQRQRGDVVGEGPEQIALDGPQGGPATPPGARGPPRAPRPRPCRGRRRETPPGPPPPPPAPPPAPPRPRRPSAAVASETAPASPCAASSSTRPTTTVRPETRPR